MEYRAPHTVEVSAKSLASPELNGSEQPSLPQKSYQNAIVQSLAIDSVLAVVAALLAALFSGAVNAISTPPGVDSLQYLPPSWLLFLVCGIAPLVWVFRDGARAISNPASLPMARSKVASKAIYAKRIHMLLLAFYLGSILVALCWSAFSMSLPSKIFVSGIFAIALYALGRSIPSRRLSFIVSGILFLVVLFTTQAFIVLKLEAEATRSNEELLNGLTTPPEEEIDPEEREKLFESRGE